MRVAGRIRDVGILASVTRRVKTIDSFLKKTIRKKMTDPMEKMHDKVGVRVVVAFVSQLEAVDAIIRDLFDVRKFEDKSEGLGEDRFAYQSWHYDGMLKGGVPAVAEKFRGLWCEIQLRTECQHLWADMAHRLLYKSEQPISEREARRVHRLNALLEIADYEFEGTRDALLSNLARGAPGSWQGWKARTTRSLAKTMTRICR